MSFNFSTHLGSAHFSNPVFTASGCAGSGKELSQFFQLSDLGAIVTKSIMLRARSGRATPRMAETPSGMLNSIGLQGPGIDQFLENDIPWLTSQGATIVVSIAGEAVEDYAILAKKLSEVTGISAVEVNISCPNVENRGQVFSCDPHSAFAAVNAVKKNLKTGIPIIAKLSPDVTDIAAIAEVCINAGANALALINTLLGMVIDINTMLPKLAGKTGGLSGPAIRPVAVRAIYQVKQRLPQAEILGMGGVTSGRDALELILAGASAVSVGTATFGNPMACIRVKAELEELLIARGFSSFSSAVGFAHRDITGLEPTEEEIDEGIGNS
jgi:dihydroorotate dehydrogenase (NAD+) catalytic subunit